MAAKRRSSGNPLLSVVAAALKPLHSGSRGMLFAIALLATFFVVIGVCWQKFGPEVLQDERFQLTIDKIQVTPQPEWIQVDVRHEAYENGSLEGMSLLDQQTIRLIVQSFSMNAWVEEVQRASKTPDGRVQVTLNYRQPVMVIAVPGGYYPVDRHGVVLPTDGFTQESTLAYLQFHAEGLHKIEQRLTGTAYGDDRVVAAAQITHALGEVWRRAGLVRIHAYRLGDSPLLTRRPTFELTTANGRRVIWGNGPGRETSNEPSPAEKVTMLAGYVSKHGEIAGVRDDPPLDLSSVNDKSEVDVARRND